MAGIFYPDSPGELIKELDRLEEVYAETPGGRIGGARAIVSPHAGLGYSGDLAALAWHSVRPRRIERVVVLSPLHRAEDALVYLPEAEYFSTPLGDLRVDHRSIAELLDCGTAFSMNDIPHFEEHGVELQLPFLKHDYPEASLVPILVGRASPALIKSLAAALGLVFGEDLGSTLFVISTDLATGSDPVAILEHSDRLLDLIEKRDWEAILEDKNRDNQSACGASCLAAWLASSVSQGTESLVLGRHDSSASRQTEQERLVGYAAMAFIDAEGSE